MFLRISKICFKASNAFSLRHSANPSMFCTNIATGWIYGSEYIPVCHGYKFEYMGIQMALSWHSTNKGIFMVITW